MPTSTRINRRTVLIECASELFLEQGYSATSIRQIAEAVGVTEAAIYYHFKDKRDLLQAVVEQNLPDMAHILEICQDATSLEDLILRFGSGMENIAKSNARKFRWIIAEFHKFTEDERNLIYEKHLFFQKTFAELVQKFVTDPKQADTIAWTIICGGFGYSQLFINLDMESQVDFRALDMIQILSSVLKDET